jgi:uncharacterized protein (DUF3084 family)
MVHRTDLWKRSSAIRQHSAALCRRAAELRCELDGLAAKRKPVSPDHYAVVERALQESRAQLKAALRDLQVEDRRLREALAELERQRQKAGATASPFRRRQGRLLSFKGKREGR